MKLSRADVRMSTIYSEVVEARWFAWVAVSTFGMSACGTKRTSRLCGTMSAFGGKADITQARLNVRY
jgi:hypothetical protein